MTKTKDEIDVESIGTKMEGRQIQFIAGAYGDGKDCFGLVEKMIMPPEGGSFCKLVGCSYLYKGFPSIHIGQTLGIPKNLLSNIPIIIHDMPWIVKIIFGFALLLTRIFSKKFLIRFAEIYAKTAVDPIRKLHVDTSKYTISVKEMIRVFDIMIGKIKNVRMVKVCEEIAYLFCMAIEYDNAYRFMIQDIFPLISVEDLKDHTVKEVKRILDIVIKRNNTKNQKRRWLKVKKVVVLALRLSPKLKRMLIDFVSEFNMNKIQRDDADWYFCLNRRKYDFKGLSHEQRMKIKEQIDKEKGHQIPILDFKIAGQEDKKLKGKDEKIK